MRDILFFCLFFSLMAQAELIKSGPFKGHEANFDKNLNAWVINGDSSKAPAAVKYGGKAITAGLSFRQNVNEPQFKKIWLLQLGNTWNELQESHDPENDLEIAKDKIEKGFGVMSGSLQALEQGRLLGKYSRNNDIILFHPKVPKAASYLFRMRSEENPEGWNTFEEGILLNYAEVDVYAFEYGTKFAKEIFPKEIFLESHKSGKFNEQDLDGLVERVGAQSMRDLHLKNLRDKLGDEYEWIVAEYR